MATKHAELVKEYKVLKGFSAHGAKFEAIVRSQGETQARGLCPFCNKPSHFYVGATTALWDCKKCGRAGNFNGFMEQVAQENASKKNLKKLITLSKKRSIKVATLNKWGVRWNGLAYTIPARGDNGCLDLRIYRPGRKTLSTPGARAWLSGYERLKAYEGTVIYITEGEWDAMALDEVLMETGSEGLVVGTPGANTFKREWVQLFYGKHVVLVYDNDESGAKGEAKTFRMLAGIAKSVRAVHWPISDALPAGFDFRDLYIAKNLKAAETLEAFKAMLAEGPRMPETSPEGSAAEGEGQNACGLQATLEGSGLPRNVVIKRYRKWMHLANAEPLDIIFGVMFANRFEGDPVWLFLIGPPGDGKSEMLMSLSKAPLAFATTSLTPHSLASGACGPGGSDPSLIPKLNGKVLVIKDFTAILSMPYMAKDEIFGTLRDIYDGEFTKIFGNNIMRHYKSRFGILAGVTPDIEAHTSAHATLGARFLNYRTRNPGSINIGYEKIARAIDNTVQEVSMRGQLQEIAAEVLNRKVTAEEIPRMPTEFKKRLVGLAQWAASMRAVVVKEKYTREILYKPSPEIGTRLGRQLSKLAFGIGVYQQAEELGEEHYRLIVKVARDTAPSRSEEIMRKLWVNDGVNEYVPTPEITRLIGLNPETTRTLLQDMTTLGIIQKEDGPGMGDRWRISPSMARLMRPLEIYKDEEHWKHAKKKV